MAGLRARRTQLLASASGIPSSSQYGLSPVRAQLSSVGPSGQNPVLEHDGAEETADLAGQKGKELPPPRCLSSIDAISGPASIFARERLRGPPELAREGKGGASNIVLPT